jgi:hypothetical protein
VSISAPYPARLGRALDYTVTLTNVSGHTLSFTPCPGYAEAIKGVVIARYLLNCAKVPLLGADQSRTFAMELPLTTVTVATGTYPLSWLIDEPYVQTPLNGVEVAVTG